MEVVIGVDTSNNGEWLGVIVGEKQHLMCLYNKVIRSINKNFIHMSKLRDKEKHAVISAFKSYKSKHVHLLCRKVDVFAMIKRIRRTNRTSGKRARGIVMKRVAKLILNELDKNFKRPAYLEIHVDREFQADVTIFKSVLFPDRIIIKGFAAELADIVAYMNFKNIQ